MLNGALAVHSAFFILHCCGCTAESVRLAIEQQRRTDEVQQAVVMRQHDALCVLMYRDVVRRIEAAGGPLNAEQRAQISEAWNDRDLAEFWLVQHERAKALRMVGVDVRLYGEQSVLDLLLKSLDAKVARVEQGVAGYVGRRVGETAAGEESEAAGNKSSETAGNRRRETAGNRKSETADERR
ncbi:MAG: hypothetical protein CHACPFDD_02163 [Phycisphaerae bacterium]|nr:hypothetical protein [Phycisphaerae bacterium]